MRCLFIVLLLFPCLSYSYTQTYTSSKFFSVCINDPKSDFCTSYVAGAIDGMAESSCLKISEQNLRIIDIVRYTVATIGVTISNNGKEFADGIPIPMMIIIGLKDNPRNPIDDKEYKSCLKQIFDASKSAQTSTGV